MRRTKVLILGAAGRDFHDFNTVFRNDAAFEVVGFTANQIPGIEARRYPPELAGPLYPEGIPIHPERDLEQLVRRHGVDEVVLAYSDLAHETVMHLASRALATGAGFRMLPPKRTMLRSKRPVVALAAVRTGCGKSQAARYVTRVLGELGKRTVVVRHPMPYGDLVAERVQRFETIADLDRAKVTVEEREDYEPHVVAGSVVFAGVDYAAILEAAEKEADVVVWDGGNNDLPFFAPDLWITVVDPHRPGHELAYHPGEANLRGASVVLVNKVDTAPAESLAKIRANLANHVPNTRVVLARSDVTVDYPELIRGKRVLLIEDGPTVTHGEMTFGAAKVAADRYGAASFADPRPVAVGSIAETYAKYPHLGAILPAVGYSPEQISDLEKTIARVECDAIVIGTPIDLAHVLRLPRPSTRVRYELADEGEPRLRDVLTELVAKLG
ncbi:cyclic 2,3-diphosphoglycerate synthase [Myxococcota bacterium]|nr:cyclic 2,3-diphosphoglycerate synthase [Myxococcota bacterium]